jgi:ubiquinone/menaquinone biosynthesis C-methylase UbiE
MTLPPSLPPESLAHYETGIEAARLTSGHGPLELTRTKELLERRLPPPPAVVLDVGGGPGVYAAWLARRGYVVHLIDAVPLHVEQARRSSVAQPQHPLASAALGDARHLEHADASVDAVLLFGPLYHLTPREDRLLALSESRRVVRPSGVVLAIAISRFASLMDGLFRGFVRDPAFARIVERDLTDGQHRNPSDNPDWFTTAFFHHPEELAAEVRESGLELEAVLAVEGPGWLLKHAADDLRDPALPPALSGMLRRIEGEPSLLGASAHLMAVARRTA